VPNPAPRFSRTPAEPRESPSLEDTLAAFGMNAGTIRAIGAGT